VRVHSTHPNSLKLRFFLSFALLTFAWLLCGSGKAVAQGAGYWHTAGNQILDANGQPVRIAGISWFGFETNDQVVHGLFNQDYHQILHAIRLAGFNTVRLPFSNQMVEKPIVPRLDRSSERVNRDLDGLDALSIFDKIVAAAGAEGLKVILDNHRSEAGDSNEHNGLWYTAAYPERNWIADWRMMADRYKNYQDAAGNPVVIGADLRNEPFRMVNAKATGACWTGDRSSGGCPRADAAHNWPAAAERAANAVLAANPNLLIFVEGIDCYNGACNWQGGNLAGAGTYPVALPVAGRLVYSAHDYGPKVSPQAWFDSSTTPESLRNHWERNWAYLSQQGTAPVWLGEFGSTNEDRDLQSDQPGSQGQWFATLINFLRDHNSIHWAYWAVNSEDAAGLLAPGYQTHAQNSLKAQQLASIQFALNSPISPAPVVAQPAPELSQYSNQPAPHKVSFNSFALIGGLTLSMGALVLVQKAENNREDVQDGQPAAPRNPQLPANSNASLEGPLHSRRLT